MDPKCHAPQSPTALPAWPETIQADLQILFGSPKTVNSMVLLEKGIMFVVNYTPENKDGYPK